MKKIIKKIVFLLFIIIASSNIFGADIVIEETSDKLNLSDMIDSLREYTDESELGSELNLEDISKNLIMGKNTDYSKSVQKIVDIFAGETITAVKDGISILIIIVIMGIFSSLEINKDSRSR